MAIGLATNFRELGHHFKGGKPLILYACGQSFNLVLSLIMAYLMFYVVFPDITASIYLRCCDPPSGVMANARAGA